jgi:hypothetical protein
MFDVFRFAWFAVRTFFGVLALILFAYGALWLFVKIHSMGPGNADPDAALRRVKSYDAQQTGRDRTAPAVAPTGAGACGAAQGAGCDRR